MALFSQRRWCILALLFKLYFFLLIGGSLISAKIHDDDDHHRIPTYWINLDARTDRASLQKSSLDSISDQVNAFRIRAMDCDDVLNIIHKADVSWSLSLLSSSSLVNNNEGIHGQKEEVQGKCQSGLDEIHTMLDNRGKGTVDGPIRVKEMAVTMSHIVAIYTAYANQESYAMIMEDDMILDNNNQERTLDRFRSQDLRSLLSNFNFYLEAQDYSSIVQLYCNGPDNRIQKLLANGTPKMVIDTQHFCWGTQQYLLSRQCMKSILEIYVPDLVLVVDNTHDEAEPPKSFDISIFYDAFAKTLNQNKYNEWIKEPALYTVCGSYGTTTRPYGYQVDGNLEDTAKPSGSAEGLFYYFYNNIADKLMEQQRTGRSWTIVKDPTPSHPNLKEGDVLAEVLRRNINFVKDNTEKYKKQEEMEGDLIDDFLSSERNTNVFASIQHLMPIAKSMNHDLVKKYKFKNVDCAGINNSMVMHDTDMIKWVCESEGEKKVTRIMMHVFRVYAKRYVDVQPSAIMLDIGANSGFYGLIAATFGLPAVLFDLQPECIAIIQNSILKNTFQDLLRVIPKGVSEGETTTIAVPVEGCEGMFPYQVLNRNSPRIQVELNKLSQYVTNPSMEISMMKIDTEGNEKRILAGAISFFRSQQIKNAVVEVSPGHGFWQKAGISNEEVADTFWKIIDECRYAMVSLVDWKVFVDGKKATDYILGNESPGQFDVWLLPVQDLHSSLNEYQQGSKEKGDERASKSFFGLSVSESNTVLAMEYSNNKDIIDKDGSCDNNEGICNNEQPMEMEINKSWGDNEKTHMMHDIIKNRKVEEFMSLLSTQPELAHIRSKDGRGPLYWAHEYGRLGMVQVLQQLGVSEEQVDAYGMTPKLIEVK